MTENEIVKQAIRCIVGACDETCKGYDAKKSVCHGYGEVASGLESILKEYEQYRAIGTVKELQSMKEHGAFTGTELAQIAVCQMELQKYMAIGTIDEFKALKEKSVAKKIIAKKKTQSYLGTDYYCPMCDKRQLTAYAISKGDDYCKDCGQKLDWSE